jgi:hypothetical protein
MYKIKRNSMKRFFMFLLLSSFVVIRAAAQSVEEKKVVMKPIKQLLEAMQKADSAWLHQAFTHEATMAIIGTDKEGKPFIRYESSVDKLLKAVGTPHAEVFNEMIWDEKISMDGNFAQVWTSYAYYVGKKFSHCGVNSFHLTKVEGSWKIFHVAFTRKSDGCNIPTTIRKQFE